MLDSLNLPLSLVMSQVLIGMMNGALYAMLSMGLALIFGMLNVVNMAHGAQFMLGALIAWIGATYLGLSYWSSVFIAPAVIGLLSLLIEVVLIRRTYKLDHIYGLLLTLGLSMVAEGLVRNYFGSTGVSYSAPAALTGTWNLGFMFLPIYRAWVVLAALGICTFTWFIIERNRLGALLRAATENPVIVRAFGVNVPLLKSLTYAGGAALAALGGVMAAPIYSVSPQLGNSFIITVFAIVVIGGMGSIKGAIIAGFLLGTFEGIAKIFWPQGSGSVIFVTMVLVLVLRPAGLFGKVGVTPANAEHDNAVSITFSSKDLMRIVPRPSLAVVCVCAIVLLCIPFVFYPILIIKILCFALFAAAFNFLAGGIGLLSFGHAAFFGGAAYVTAYCAKHIGMTPELAILMGAGAAGIVGLFMGWLAIRRSGIYFSMITLALAQLIYFGFVQAPFTGGEDGIQSVPRGSLFGVIPLKDDLTMYFVVASIFGICIYLLARIHFSPVGHAIRSTRENEQRAISLGYSPRAIKLFAFVVSAVLSGVAGGTKAIAFGSASLIDASWSTSGEVVLMTLIGGMGTMLGPIVGSSVVVVLESSLSSLMGWVMVVQGLVFIVCVVIFRRGIVGEIANLLRRKRASAGLPVAAAGWLKGRSHQTGD